MKVLTIECDNIWMVSLEIGKAIEKLTEELGGYFNIYSITVIPDNNNKWWISIHYN